MSKKNGMPTMKDVAAEANVALGTVSKVFNGIPVGETYRIRVEEAAEKLGYKVNNYARGMRTNKTNTIAIIMPLIDHPFFSQLTQCIIRELQRRDYKSLIAITDYEKQTEKNCISMVAQHKADGIIALTYNPNFEEIGDIPFVCIDRSFGGKVPCVASDNYSGGQMAAEKLSELGCRKLMFFRTGSAVPSETDKRGAGFETYCMTHHIPYKVFSYCEPYDTDYFSEISQLIDDGQFDYDGIFCSTDRLAGNLCALLRRKGLRVPEEVQIIGFDGIRDFLTGEYICSTIVQPIEQMAKVAVSTLLNLEKDDNPLSLVCLPVTYVPGSTTKDGNYGK